MEIHPGKKLQSLMAVYVASISAMTAYHHCNGKAPIFTGAAWGQLYEPLPRTLSTSRRLAPAAVCTTRVVPRRILTP